MPSTRLLRRMMTPRALTAKLAGAKAELRKPCQLPNLLGNLAWHAAVMFHAGQEEAYINPAVHTSGGIRDMLIKESNIIVA